MQLYHLEAGQNDYQMVGNQILISFLYSKPHPQEISWTMKILPKQILYVMRWRQNYERQELKIIY